MAQTKVSALTELTSPDGAEELLINDGGTSKKVTITNANKKLFSFLDANGNYIQMQKGGDIASASPTVIDTDGDYFICTGTTGFTTFTVAADRHFFLEFTAALTMTHGAGTLDLPGGANITTAASDVGEFYSTASNVVTCVNYTKADGTPIAVNIVDDTSPQLGGFLDANGNYIQTEKGGDITSADPLVIDTDGDYFDVTGTVSFTAMTVAADRQFTLQFNAALTMTHHATNLDLPSEANITTAAGDVATFQSTGSNTVQCINYTKADGTAVVDANTTYSAGSLLDLSTTTFNVDLSELTDGTDDVVGSADELVYLDASSQKRKQIDEIKLGQFNNDQSWTANAGTMTDVADDTTPQLGGDLDCNGSQIQWSQGADVASATALAVLTDGNYFDVTGTTTITSINTTGGVGTLIKLHFDAILTLTHHATDLILPGGANITTAAGDEAEFIEYATGDYRCTNYSKASGNSPVDSLPLAGGTMTGALTGTTATFSTADNLDTLTLISTDADANAAPNLRLYRNSGSPAQDDLLGQIEFESRNDNSQDVVYYQIKTMATDITDGNEESVVHHKIMKSGTLRDVLLLGRTEVVINEDAQDIDFRVESDTVTHALFVQGSDGNVGIGTSSIDVSTQSGGSGYRVLQIESTNGGQLNFDHNDAGTGSTLGQINFQRAGEVLAEIEGVTSGATDNGHIAFRTQATGGALTERMRINSNGTVTIDQDTDNEALIIDSESTSDWATKINAKYGLRVQQDISGGYAGYFVRNIAEAGSNSLVRIIDDHTSNTQTALFLQQDGAGRGIDIDQNGDGIALRIDSESANQFTMESYGKYVLRAEQDISGGRGVYIKRNLAEAGSNPLVEIKDDHTSNTQPALKIQQDGAGYGLSMTTAGRGIDLTSSATDDAAVWLVNSSCETGSGSALQVYSNSAHTGTRNVCKIHNDHASSTGTTALYVQQDSTGAAAVFEGGNVGIGTDDPNVSLHIDNLASGMPVTSGTEQTYGAFRIQNTNNNTLDFGFDQTNGAWLQTGYAPSLITDNVYSLLLNPNGGNVGIGTASPSVLLDLEKNTDGAMNELIRLTNDPGGSTQVGTGVSIAFANYHSGTEVSSLRSIAEGTTGQTGLQFYTHSGSSLAEKARIDADGNVKVYTGNLVIGTAGKGIDFSATADGTTMSSELLDDYEEGEYDVVATAATSGTITMSGAYEKAQYTKIGRVVHVQGYCDPSSFSSPVGEIRISLPFTSANLTDFSGWAVGNVVSWGIAFSGYLAIRVTEGVAYAVIVDARTGTTGHVIEDEELTLADFHFSITYIAA